MVTENFSLDKLADPAFFQENRLAAHSDHEFFQSELEMAKGESAFVRSLDGLWYFHHAKNLAMRPVGFETMSYDCHAWDTIRVPAHWQLEGYGRPQYTNQTYPWDGHEVVRPGEIPERENPVGSYVKYFSLPANWENAYISLQGTESGVAVWLNGHYVGYSEDSFTPADFDLTPYLVQGENKLALQVYRFTSGSWIEDQDFWRFSGIFREVLLYTKPAVHIEDLEVKAVPVHDYQDGEIGLKVKWNTAAAKSWQVKLFAPDGELVTEEKQELSGSEEAELKFSVAGARLWSAEAPHLYKAVLYVYDGEGNLHEVVPQEIGIREFRLDPEDKLMKINGKRIVFKGTNRHEFDCYRGRAMEQASFEQDIIVMKQHNINALRCSHYPNSSYIYKLCDRYGLYVIDETNLETHGTWQKNGQLAQDEYTLPNDHEEWLEIILDRAKSMLERDKNHASIIIWSCGNESCGGRDVYEMSEYFRHRDPSRLVHYESIFWDRRYNDTSDMESQMYPKVADIEEFLAEHRDKPFLCCEYTHSMGNSNGGMHKYTELTDTEPLYQGGFIWDFVDQALWHKDRYGKDALGYGGDFGDRPTDYDFSGDGILFADRRPTTKLQEVKFNYQNFTLLPGQKGVTIENKSLFTDTESFDLCLSLLLEGKEVWTKKMAAPSILPGEKGKVELDLPNFGAGEYVLTASLCLKEDTAWAKAGFELAFGQGVWQQQAEAGKAPATLPARYVPHLPLEGEKNVKVVRGDITLGVQGEGFEILFSSGQGNMTSYKVNGVELLDRMPQPNFWRAPVNNDYGSRRDFEVAQWKLASLYQRCVKKEMMIGDSWQEFNWFGQLGQKEYEAEEVSLRFTYELATQPASSCTVTYTVRAGGAVKVAMDYQCAEGLPEMPDFALILALPADYDKLRFYGFGPLDNYCDRQQGARLGIYEQTVAEQVEPYLMPQECGNHGGIRWFEVLDNRGRGLKIYGDKPFEASALPYTAHELENARHSYELPQAHHTYLRASLGQCGVGGDDTWGAPVLEEYRPKNEDKHFEFWVQGI